MVTWKLSDGQGKTISSFLTIFCLSWNALLLSYFQYPNTFTCPIFLSVIFHFRSPAVAYGFLNLPVFPANSQGYKRLHTLNACICCCISAQTWNKVKVIHSRAVHLIQRLEYIIYFLSCTNNFIYFLENKLIIFTLNIQKLYIITVPGTGDIFCHSVFIQNALTN